MPKKTVIPARTREGEFEAFDVLASHKRLSTPEQEALEKQFRAAFRAGAAGKGWERFNKLVGILRSRAASTNTPPQAFQKYLDRLVGAGGYQVQMRRM
jgi:hypothetical protein